MRSATAARLALGTACLAVPGAVLGAVGGPDRDDPRSRLVTRVLGGRLVLQVAGNLAVGRRMRRLDVLVDLTHAVSMVPLAFRSPSHRRTAVTSAAVAIGIALLDLVR